MQRNTSINATSGAFTHQDFDSRSIPTTRPKISPSRMVPKVKASVTPTPRTNSAS